MTAPQNPETAAREASSRQILDEIADALESRGYVHLTNGKGIASLLDELDALRPTASPGEVTVTEAMVEVGAIAIRALVAGPSERPIHGDGEHAIGLYTDVARAALTAALSARTDAEAWQPIETYDGRDHDSVLLFNEEWWNFGEQLVGWRESGTWLVEGVDISEDQPTHWRRLPFPPALRSTTQTETEADDGR